MTDAGLIVHRAAPFNAETMPGRLRAAFVTPQDSFYVRSHGIVPDLDAAGYRLRVEGMVASPLNLSLEDVRQFPVRTVTAVLQCAGNRRADLQAVAPVTGDPWGPGAIGNAEWSGAALGDVLRAAGVQEASGLHAAFDAHDECEGGSRYGVSIPLDKALHPDTLLAYAMNGEPLRPEHGFPLRVVTPGYAGVRSPKWLASVTVQDHSSDNDMQQREYKLFPPDVTADSADWNQGTVINEMPVTSAICTPCRGETVPAGPVNLRGYAASGLHPVSDVEVSADGGATWTAAHRDGAADGRWSWVFWTACLDLPAGRHELAVRARDAGGGTQPADAAEAWNFPGYLGHAWHRIPVLAR